MSSLIPPLQTISTASWNVSVDSTGEWPLHIRSSSRHSSPVAAWKQPSGLAMCIFISLITIRGGRLLKVTNAWSTRNIQRKMLSRQLVKCDEIQERLVCAAARQLTVSTLPL